MPATIYYKSAGGTIYRRIGESHDPVCTCLLNEVDTVLDALNAAEENRDRPWVGDGPTPEEAGGGRHILIRSPSGHLMSATWAGGGNCWMLTATGNLLSFTPTGWRPMPKADPVAAAPPAHREGGVLLGEAEWTEEVGIYVDDENLVARSALVSGNVNLGAIDDDVVRRVRVVPGEANAEIDRAEGDPEPDRGVIDGIRRLVREWGEREDLRAESRDQESHSAPAKGDKA